jgi:hypothetical protein
MEILDGKEKAIPLYLGLPLYYIWGIILFVMANLVYLMYLYPDVLENEVMLREGNWMLYSGIAGATVHLLIVSIWRAKEDTSGIIETIVLIIIVTPILFLMIGGGIIIWIMLATYLLYVVIFSLWSYWAELLLMSIYQYNLGLLIIQSITLLLGSIIIHTQIYDFRPENSEDDLEIKPKPSTEN